MSNQHTFRTVGGMGLLLLLAAAPCLAGSGALIRLPQTGVKMKSGLKLEIDTRGSDANGYRPIRVKVTNSPPVASTFDRQVRVTMEMQGWGAYGRLSVSKVLEIPEGGTSAEEVISVPNDGRANYMNLEVREGGQRLDDLSMDYLVMSTFGGRGGDETFPSMLFIDAKVPSRSDRDTMVGQNAAQVPDNVPTYELPDFRNVVAATHDGNNTISQAYGAMSDRSLVTLLESAPRLEVLPLSELPQRWIDLSAFSIAFISRADLKTLGADFPEQKAALQNWLAAGAVLVVTGAGDDYEHLAEIEKLLELPPRPAAAKKGIKDRGWIPADPADQHKRPKSYGSSSPNYGINSGGMAMATTATNEETPVAPSPPTSGRGADGDPPFVSRPAHLGWLIAVPEAKPYPGQIDRWEWLLASIPDQRESWSHRHGMTLTGRNDGFWNWHIPGVGAAPVFSFLCLATLFAIVIGPLNYLVLGRMQRLSLLLITVPAGALIVTLSLFLYALMTDGLGVRSRVRSYTMIDQRTGQMVSWSRQTYFASIAPSRGLKFPADTTVFPLEQQQNEWVQYRAIDWEADGQRLKSGFLSSRSLEQFMVVRAGKSETKLEVKQLRNSAPPQVHNSLGSQIQFLVVRDKLGKYYYSAANLKQDAGGTLTKADAADARKQPSKIIRQQEPLFPEGYDPTMSGNAMTRLFGGPWAGAGSYSGISTRISLLEKSLEQISSSSTDLLEPGTYLAVVDVAPDVPMGVSNSRQKESLHLIHGRW